MKQNCNFQSGGSGVETKNPFVGRVWIFLEQHITNVISYMYMYSGRSKKFIWCTGSEINFFMLAPTGN